MTGLHRKSTYGIVAVLLALLLAACGSDTDDATPTAANPPAGNGSTASTPIVQAALITEEAPGSGSTAERPAEPAPPDGDFRSDSAALVGATGNPQLLEFFTYW